MNHNQYKFTARIWLYPGLAGWHFITVPKSISEDITHNFADKKRGWGSLPVMVSIGKTSWRTSIFPDTKIGSYLLPLKADVRKREKIHADDTIELQLEILA
jgi:hypothetical protein